MSRSVPVQQNPRINPNIYRKAFIPAAHTYHGTQDILRDVRRVAINGDVSWVSIAEADQKCSMAS